MCGKTFQRECNECGETFQAKRREAEFCGDKCRKAYHNRRMTRGAELYDMLMTMRFDRGHAKDEQLWSHLCAVASAYRDADKAQRGGRRSWDKNHHKTLPLAYSAGQGDGR